MTLHQLSDVRVHASWSPSHSAILTVESGDEVQFRTRDGFDGQLEGLAADALDRGFDVLDFDRIAPLTGPVAVAGAEPGDAIRVEILELAPTGPGWTVVWPAWAGFDFHRPTNVPLGGQIRVFDEASLTRADSVGVSSAIVPLRPMLGMVGVAPPVGDFATLPPREFGGNLDLRELGVGAAIRLPVFVEGALLSLGDGHAAQGDGELCTTAIECAMTGRLRVTLEKGSAPTHVEVETEDNWIVTGFGRTLDDAVRAACEGMHAKLLSIGLDPFDAYMLLSLAGHVGVNQVVNFPHVGARVAISKEVLGS